MNTREKLLVGGFMMLPLTGTHADTPLFTLPAASLIQLEKAITIPAHKAKVIYQAGQPVSYTDVKQYHPHCYFEVNTVRNQDYVVQPGPLRVMKVRHGAEPIDRITDNLITQLRLRSYDNPDIRAISCEQWWSSDLPHAKHINQEQFVQTVGGAFSLPK